MADIAIAPTPFVAGTASIDVRTAAAQVKSVIAGNYAVISAGGNTANLTISVYNASGGATFQFIEGDNPPSLNAGIGDGTAQSVAAGAAVLCTMPGGQYVQDDGTIRILIGTNTCIVGAFRAAREQ